MLKRSMILMTVVSLLLQVLPAYAQHKESDKKSEHHEESDWKPGHHVDCLGRDNIFVLAGGLGYFYWEGLFYQRAKHKQYVVVEPPIDAVVPALPYDCSSRVINGMPYYRYKDIYYVPDPKGYRVVMPPSIFSPLPYAQQVVAIPSTSVVQQVSSTPSSVVDTYDIYIPNEDKSYSLITLKKVENGYVGPQGELYPEYPTVQKLKLLYGRKS